MKGNNEVKRIGDQTLLSLNETNQLYVFLKNYRHELIKQYGKDIDCIVLKRYIKQLNQCQNEIVDFLNK